MHREARRVADEAARRAEAEAEAPDDPDQRDDSHADVVLDDDGPARGDGVSLRLQISCSDD